MPEINPYEAPQSELSKTVDPPPSDGEGYPDWIGMAVNLQLGLILALFILAMFISGPPSLFTELLGLLVSVLYISLFVGLLFAGIRYRLGWLLLIELIVLGLPAFCFIMSLLQSLPSR